MDHRSLAAREIARRIQKLIDSMWNSTNFPIRHAFRCTFYGVKPTVLDFLINAALIVWAEENPEA